MLKVTDKTNREWTGQIYRSLEGQIVIDLRVEKGVEVDNHEIVIAVTQMLEGIGNEQGTIIQRNRE